MFFRLLLPFALSRMMIPCTYALLPSENGIVRRLFSLFVWSLVDISVCYLIDSEMICFVCFLFDSVMLCYVLCIGWYAYVACVRFEYL